MVTRKMTMSGLLVAVILTATTLEAEVTNNRVLAKDDKAFLCFKRDLHPNWPEWFAIQVKILEVMAHRYKVKVENEFPMAGRTNEEEVPVQGDVLKISRDRVYTREQAGVAPGIRFDGKPVCWRLMDGKR